MSAKVIQFCSVRAMELGPEQFRLALKSSAALSRRSKTDGSATKQGAISIVMKPELSATADTNSTELPSSAADLTESSPAFQAV